MAELNQFSSRSVGGAGGAISTAVLPLELPVGSQLKQGDRVYQLNGELTSLTEQTFINHLVMHDNDDNDFFDGGGAFGFLPNGNFIVINGGSTNRNDSQRLYYFEYSPEGELVRSSNDNSSIENLLGSGYQLIAVNDQMTSMVFQYTQNNGANHLLYINFSSTTGALQSNGKSDSYVCRGYTLVEGTQRIWTITNDDDFRSLVRSGLGNAGDSGRTAGVSNNPSYLYNLCKELNYEPLTGGVIPLYDYTENEFYILGITSPNANELATVNALGDKSEGNNFVRWFTINPTTKGCVFYNASRGGLHYAQISWDADNSTASYQLNGILDFSDVHGHDDDDNNFNLYVQDGDLHYDNTTDTLTWIVNNNKVQAAIEITGPAGSLVVSGTVANVVGVQGKTFSIAKQRVVGTIHGQAKVNGCSITSLIATLNNPPVYVGIVQSVENGIAEVSLKSGTGIDDVVVSSEPAPVGSEWISVGDVWIQKSGIRTPYFDGLNTVGYSITSVFDPVTSKYTIGNVNNNGVVVEIQSPINAQLEVSAALSCTSTTFTNYFGNNVTDCEGVMAMVGDGVVLLGTLNGRSVPGDPVSAQGFMRSFGPMLIGAVSFHSGNGGQFTYDLEIV